MIYIIVPVFKRLEKTKHFLESLKKSLAQKAYRMILVDDSPVFEHYSYYGESGVDIFVVKGNGELYWGGGINLGIEYLHSNFDVISSDVILFANNDILLKKDTFQIMFDYFNRHNKSVILHPKLIDHLGNIISSGSRVKSWFPFITDHSLSETQDLNRVDLASARFLMFSGKTLLLLGGVNPTLPHYGGDNEFTYRASKEGINTYIVSSAIVEVDESETGEKAANMNGVGELAKSFFSIKSPNSLKYRYKFVSIYFNPVASFAIVFSMTIKAIVAYCLKRKY